MENSLKLVTDKQTVNNVIPPFLKQIRSNESLKKIGYTFGYKTDSRGSKDNGPPRYSLFFGFGSGAHHEALVEVTVPFFENSKLAKTYGRLAVKGDEYFLLRAVNPMTTTKRINISNKVEEILTDQIIKINNKLWIVFCSISNFNVDQLINVLRKIKNCRHDHAKNDIAKDIINLTKDKDISETDKEQLISSRLGQGKFRKRLKDYWHGSCAVTKCSKTDILIASHIKPWADSNNQERLDPYNGLLLSPNIDRLFDNGYITFTNKGGIIISKSLSDKDKKTLGLSDSYSIRLSSKHLKYIEFHRKKVFEKWNK